MSKDQLITKFISSLSALSNKDLKELIYAFGNIRTRRAITDMMKSMLEMRNANLELFNKSKSTDSTHEMFNRPVFKNKSNVKPRSLILLKSKENRIKRMFYRYLGDRDIFPSTKDVVNVANSAFNCRIDYEKYKKRGRKDVINRCWTHLSDIPENQRENMLKAFINSLPKENKESSAYQELFKILTRNE